MTIFTTGQRAKLRNIRAALKVYGQLDRHPADQASRVRHWQATAAAAREALTIIQTAVLIDDDIEKNPAIIAARAEGAIIEIIQAEVEEFYDEDNQYNQTMFSARTAIREIFEELYGQLVAQVEALEALTTIEEPNPPVKQTNAPTDQPSSTAIEEIEPGLVDVDEVWLAKPGEIEPGFSTHSPDE